MNKFINEYEMTEDLYVEQYSHPGYLWTTIFFVFATIMFIISGWWILCVISIVFALIVGFLAVREDITLRDAYRNQLKEHENMPCQIRVEFTQNKIRFITSYGADEELPYDAIFKSLHKQELIVFIIDRGYHISVKKDAFSEGSLSCFISSMSIRGL